MCRTKTNRLFFVLFVVCIFSLSLGQFSAIYSLGQGTIYLFDVLFMLFDFLGLIYLAKLRQVKIPLAVISLLTSVALGLFSLLFTPLNLEIMEFLTALAYPLRLLAYILFALTVGNFVRADLFRIDAVYRVIVYTGIFLFVAGIFQLIVLPDLEALDPALGWDPHKNRMASTFFDPNFLGMYFVVCLAASMSINSSRSVTETKQLSFSKRLYPLAPIIFLTGIFLTFSRSAWLATGVLVFFAGLKNRMVLLVAVSLVLLAVFAIPRVQTRISGITDPQDSASFRLISWQNTLEIVKDNWVFGVGYNAFRYAQRDYGFIDDHTYYSRSGAGSDSSLLLVWATSGIFGLIFFLGFFLSTLLIAAKHSDLTAIGLIFAMLVNSLFINSLFYPQILVSFLLLLSHSNRVVAAKGFEPLTPAM